MENRDAEMLLGQIVEKDNLIRHLELTVDEF